MIQIDELIWYVDGPVVRWITMPFPTRMVLVRLQKGGLFVHSPVRLTDGLKDAVTRLGDPMFIVSPNRLHHIFLPEWQTAFPDAKIFSPPGLAQRKPEVEFFSELRDTPEPEWAGDVDQLIFRGSRVLDEVVFFHKPSATLILGDLIENFDPQTLGPFHRILARLDQIVAPRGRTPFDFRSSFLGNHDQAQACICKIRNWSPRRVVMCHGVPVFENAESFLAHAFAWISGRKPYQDG